MTTRRAIRDFRPFEFRSDFEPKAPGPETLALTAADLAALLGEARAEGAAAMASLQVPTGELPHDRLDAAALKLNDALADLVALAHLLEETTETRPIGEEARRLINLAAARIIDGQGDLFGG